VTAAGTQARALSVFVTRKPVFDRHKRVYAYELLFRAGPGGEEGDPEGAGHADDVRRIEFKAGLSSVNLTELTDGRRAMIPVSADLLGDEDLHRLPRDKTVLLLLPDLRGSTETVDLLRQFKRAGFKMALADYRPQDPRRLLTRFVDMMFVDFAHVDDDAAKALCDEYRTAGLSMVAKGINDAGAHDLAEELAFDFCQGSFYRAAPEDDEDGELAAYKVNYLSLLRQVHQETIQLNAIEEIIKRDVSLTYRLLKYINSAAFGLRNTVKSTRQALVLLGESGIRRWGSLISVTCMGKDKPTELMVCSLVRARFCESIGIALRMTDEESELFLLGLFSLIDVIAGRPMHKMLEDIPLSPNVKSALEGDKDLSQAVATGGRNRMREVLGLVVAYESGDWMAVTELSESLGLNEDVVPDLYVAALDWARRTLKGA